MSAPGRSRARTPGPDCSLARYPQRAGCTPVNPPAGRATAAPTAASTAPTRKRPAARSASPVARPGRSTVTAAGGRCSRWHRVPVPAASRRARFTAQATCRRHHAAPARWRTCMRCGWPCSARAGTTWPARHGPTTAGAAQAAARRMLGPAALPDPAPVRRGRCWGPAEGRRLVEMDTGEGKSLAIVLAAATAALAGVPVHVITSQRHTWRRATPNAPPRCWHATRPGAAGHPARGRGRRAPRHVRLRRGLRHRPRDRLRLPARPPRAAAARARRSPGGASPCLRGLCLALIDEADSVLIDHARTPLVIAVRSELSVSTTASCALHEMLYPLAATTAAGAPTLPRSMPTSRQVELGASGAARSCWP